MTAPPSEIRKRWRLSTRLTLAMLAIFAVIFTINVISHAQYRSDRRESRIEGMHQVSRTIAAAFEGFAGDLESFSLSTAITLGEARVSTDPADSERLQPTVGPYLQHLFESYEVLRAIFVTNTDGVVALSDAGINGADLSDRSYIRALQDGAPDFWSEGFAGAQSGVTTIAYSRRIVNPDGVTTGFLVIAFYPQELATRLPPNLLEEGHVTVVDRAGEVLLSLPEPPDGENTDDAMEHWAEILNLDSNEELITTRDPNLRELGDDYASLVGMDQLGWVLGYSLPTNAIEGQANSLFQRDMAILAAVLLLGLLIMHLLANRLSHPLSRLTAGAAAIAGGEQASLLLDTQSSDADVAILASTMNQMQKAVEQRESQLRVQTSNLEAIERMGESLAQELDLDKVIEAIADCGLDLTEAQAAIFLYRDEYAGKDFLEPTQARRRLLLSAGNPIVREVMEGALVYIPDDAMGEGDRADAPKSVLGIPIRSRRNEVEGGLFLLHSHPHAFEESHQRLAMGLARWSSIVLENAKLFRQSQELLGEVQKASQDKDEFLAVISHELRTPITTIYGGTRLMRIRREQLSPEAMDDMIVSVAEESERLYRLVEDLLAIARTEMSQGVEREPVSISAVVEQSVAQLHRLGSRPIEVRIADDLPAAFAEPSYLVHVVYNLLSNANKYVPEAQPIEIEAALEDGEIVLRIMDRGPGVSADQLGQIFDSFYRTKDATERAAGKGLGLTVCKRLVEALSGRIWAQNRPGGGLEVRVALEVAHPNPEDASGEDQL